MATGGVSRETESRAVEEFLALVPSGPSALVVEGEAGIGKTTVWLAGLERAQELEFWVLSARATVGGVGAAVFGVSRAAGGIGR